MRLEVLLDGLPKRLDLARDAGAKHEEVPGMIMANWVERL